ncbi:hypothetical protein CU097_004053 [Rhizopus azygosporus]|uniref:Uncharacterized protein n=1 Tax=Rhizopus azygosporus TaxID=86630 RepID=A0A367J1Z4_RHIAZ|nr:hypothetical protein CU097_004053 [Rhizopus azygosporus]
MSTIAKLLILYFIILVNLVLLYRYFPHKPQPPYVPTHYGLSLARPEHRKYTSPAVEQFLTKTESQMKDKDLYVLLQNCLPNTLDTTIEWFNYNNTDPRTFLITGDIPAMWIRDSTNQISPYIRFVNEDPGLKDLVFGVIQVQASYLDYDPYANAFLRPWYAPPVENPRKGSTTDKVTPAYDPAIVWESKYELDSISHFFKLTNDYVDATGEIERVLESTDWMNAATRVLKVLQDQMKDTWPSTSTAFIQDDPQRVPLEQGYRFTRYTDRPTETLGQSGIGGIGKKCGLIKSAFRPSDDATTLPYLIPANAHISVELTRLSKHIRAYTKGNYRQEYKDLAEIAHKIGQTVKIAVERHGVVTHPVFGQIYAYEVDCYGSVLIMDDANLPSLLSLPYLGFATKNDIVYQNTRRLILSHWNPWYFEGKFVKGIGSPHTGEDMVWPMSILMQIKTSSSEHEIRKLIDLVKQVAKSANSLMCESINSNEPSKYTRSWFSWANGLAGSTIIDLIQDYPHLV